ncbi:MAG: tetratricopeptide repeat protein [Thermodesulfobacteriota bacterium]
MSPKVLLVIALAIVTVFGSLPALGQSKDQGVALAKEADELRKNAKSNDDRVKALQKYREALAVFVRVGDADREATTLNYIGWLQDDLGKYPDAIESYEKALSIRRRAKDAKREAVCLNNIGLAYVHWKQAQKGLEYYEKALEIQTRLGDTANQAIALNNMGSVYRSLAQPAKALECYEKELPLRRNTGDTAGVISCLDTIAKLYRDQRQFQKALEYFDQELQLKRNAGNVKGEGVTLYEMAKVSRDLSQYDKALEYFMKSLAIDRRLGHTKDEATTLDDIAGLQKGQRKYQEALEHYERALQLKRKDGNVKGEGLTLYRMAQVFRDLKQFDKATAYLARSLEIDRRLGDIPGEAATLEELAKLHKDQRQFDKAFECYEQVVQLKRKAGNLKGEGITLLDISRLYRDLSQFRKAMEYCEKSLRIRREANDLKGEGTTLDDKGRLHEDVSEYQQALDCYEGSLEIDRKLGDVRGEGITLNNIGQVHKKLGRHTKALEYYKKSLEIHEKRGDVVNQGIALNNMASAYRNQGQYRTALEYYEKSLPYRRKGGDAEGEAITLNDIGLVYWDLGRYQDALKYYDQSLAVKRDIAKPKGEAITLNNIGLVSDDLGQYQKALEYYEKALSTQRRLEDAHGEKITLSNIASTYNSLGQAQKALEYYRNAIDIGKRIGVPVAGSENAIAGIFMDKRDFRQAEVFLRSSGYNSNWGRYYLLQTDFSKAREYYEKVLQWAEGNRDAKLLFTAYTGLGRTSEGLEDYEKAIHYYSKAVDFVEEMRASLNPGQRTNFYEVQINGFYRSEPAHGLTRVKMKMNRSADSIASSEVIRARTFTEHLAGRSGAGIAGVPTEIRTRGPELEERIAGLRQARSKIDRQTMSDAYEQSTKEIERAEKELDAFVEQLWKTHEAYAAVKYPRPVKLKDAEVRPDEHLLMFDVVGEGVGVKLLKGKEIITTFYVKWDERDLEDHVKRFRQPFEKFDLRGFDPELGRTLFKRLVGRALYEIPEGTPVTVIPDGVLATLPFEALVMEGKVQWSEGPRGPSPAGLRFLGDAYPLSYYQSITALDLARRHAKKAPLGNRMLVVADPVFSPDDDRSQAATKASKRIVLAALPTTLMSIQQEMGIKFERLPRTAELADSLKRAYTDQADIMTGLEAQKEALFGKRLDQYRYLVFATHGYFGTDLPGLREPILAMTLVDQPEGKDGFLRMTEVMGLSLNADVVALTACQTGLGRQLRGEGTLGMGRAFQYSGARSVLMSLWSVAESSSVGLVDRFFRHLKEGKPKLDALALARKEIRAQGWDHPFFWAPFILVGEVR